MELGGYIFGIFPRSEHLIDISRSDDEFAKNAKDESRSLMEIQVKYGLNYINDPQLTWDDMFRPIVFSQSGFTINGLTRYFETNTFYKMPVIDGKIEHVNCFENCALQSESLSEPSLISLPDPFTFFSMSKNNWYSDESSLIRDLGKLLAGISRDLKNYGYKLLVLKGPMYAMRDAVRFSESIKDSIHEIKDAFSGKVFLHTYFGDPTKNSKVINGLDIDGLGLDPKFLPTGSERLFGIKGISVGVIDGLNTRMETMNEIRSTINDVKKKFNPENLFITNNIDLEFLPQQFAINKVKLIGDAVKVLNDEAL